MSYKVNVSQSFFVEDLTQAREIANTITSMVEPVSDSVVSNFAKIEDMSTRKTVPLRDPETSVAYRGRQDLTTQVMALVKTINESEENTHDLDSEEVSEQAVILPEGQTDYAIKFKILAEAVSTVRPDLTNPKEINNVVKKAWAQVLASQADKISFK